MTTLPDSSLWPKEEPHPPSPVGETEAQVFRIAQGHRREQSRRELCVSCCPRQLHVPLRQGWSHAGGCSPVRLGHPTGKPAQLLGVRSGAGPELVLETFSGAERAVCSRSTRSSCRVSDTLLTQIKGAKPFFWALRTLPPSQLLVPVAHGRRMPKEPGFHPPASPPSSPLTASPGGGGPGAGSCAFRMK